MIEMVGISDYALKVGYDSKNKAPFQGLYFTSRVKPQLIMKQGGSSKFQVQLMGLAG